MNLRKKITAIPKNKGLFFNEQARINQLIIAALGLKRLKKENLLPAMENKLLQLFQPSVDPDTAIIKNLKSLTEDSSPETITQCNTYFKKKLDLEYKGLQFYKTTSFFQTCCSGKKKIVPDTDIFANNLFTGVKVFLAAKTPLEKYQLLKYPKNKEQFLASLSLEETRALYQSLHQAQNTNEKAFVLNNTKFALLADYDHNFDESKFIISVLNHAKIIQLYQNYKHLQANIIKAATLPILTSIFSDQKINNSLVSQITNKEIPISIIGQGSYGIVCSFEDANHKKYALKINTKQLEKENEISILKKINHPNIIKMHACIEGKNLTPIIIMDYAPNGDMHKNKSLFLENKQKKQHAIQLLQTLAYLHQKGIIQKDIKPENLLLDENNDIKLTDFGLSVYTENDTNRDKLAGTPYYMAPEIILGKKITPAVDIYSAGCVLYELLYQKPLMRSYYTVLFQAHKYGMAFQFADMEMNLKIPDSFEYQMLNIIRDMVIPDADQRPTATELITKVEKVTV